MRVECLDVCADSQDFGVSVSGEFSGVSFALGYAKDDNAAATAVNNVTAIGLGYGMGAIDVQAIYVMEDSETSTADVNSFGLSIAYTSGAMTLTAAMSDSDADNTDAAMGVGVAYDLGGGLAVKGAVGAVDDKTVADLGLTMSF